MKSLASPVTEYRIMGAIECIGGLGAGAVAMTQVRSTREAVVYVVITALAGAVMYWSLRREVLESARDASVVTDADRESFASTLRRAALIACAILGAFIVWAVVTDEPGITAAITISMGSAWLGTGQRLRTWERHHGVRLWREAQWPFSNTFLAAPESPGRA